MHSRAFAAAAAIGLTALAISLPASAAEDPYASVREHIDLCESCHGAKGASQDPTYPIIAGQQFYYMYVQLKDFKAGRRENELMAPALEGLEREQMKLIAQYFSEQTWPETGYTADPALVAQGESATSAGMCTQCHLGTYEGNSRVPHVAGQWDQYLEKTLQDLKNGRRKNAAAMASLMEAFSDKDITAMAAFLAAK